MEGGAKTFGGSLLPALYITQGWFLELCVQTHTQDRDEGCLLKKKIERDNFAQVPITIHSYTHNVLILQPHSTRGLAVASLGASLPGTNHY